MAVISHVRRKSLMNTSKKLDETQSDYAQWHSHWNTLENNSEKSRKESHKSSKREVTHHVLGILNKINSLFLSETMKFQRQ